MGYLRIKCYYCGGTWEVYHRDLHSRYKKARECPHCFQKIDEQAWDRQIFPAYNALDDANRELFKDHLGYHVPLFEVSYESYLLAKIIISGTVLVLCIGITIWQLINL